MGRLREKEIGHQQRQRKEGTAEPTQARPETRGSASVFGWQKAHRSPAREDQRSGNGGKPSKRISSKICAQPRKPFPAGTRLCGQPESSSDRRPDLKNPKLD